MKQLRFHGTKIVEGNGSLSYVKELSWQKAMIITGGQSMFANGTIGRVVSYLKEGNNASVCGTPVADRIKVYSGIPADPTTAVVEKCLAVAREWEPDLFVAVGGGSALDAAKAVALLYEYPELNFDNILKMPLPTQRKRSTFVAIPSTSGTASEVTVTSVITFEKDQIKRGIKTEAMRPDVAILDGDITLSLPARIAAETGMDALTHAIECYINRNADDFTTVLAKGAVEGLMKWLPISCETADAAARQKVHNYQCMAGMAFGNVGLGAVHGMAHALGGRYGESHGLTHGLVNAVMLPYVMEYNSQDPQVSERLAELSSVVGGSIVDKVWELQARLGIPSTICQCGLTPEEFEAEFQLLLANSLQGSTRANPIPVSEEDMKVLLRRVFYGK